MEESGPHQTCTRLSSQASCRQKAREISWSSDYKQATIENRSFYFAWCCRTAWLQTPEPSSQKAVGSDTCTGSSIIACDAFEESAPAAWCQPWQGHCSWPENYTRQAKKRVCFICLPGQGSSRSCKSRVQADIHACELQPHVETLYSIFFGLLVMYECICNVTKMWRYLKRWFKFWGCLQIQIIKMFFLSLPAYQTSFGPKSQCTNKQPTHVTPFSNGSFSHPECYTQTKAILIGRCNSIAFFYNLISFYNMLY